MPGSAIRKSCAIAILETQERGYRGSRVSSCYSSESATCDASAPAPGQTVPEGRGVARLRKAVVGCPFRRCMLPRQEPLESRRVPENRNRVRRATRGTVFSSAGPGLRKPASGRSEEHTSELQSLRHLV